jgi:hypothetical protein
MTQTPKKVIAAKSSEQAQQSDPKRAQALKSRGFKSMGGCKTAENVGNTKTGVEANFLVE